VQTLPDIRVSQTRSAALSTWATLPS